MKTMVMGATGYAGALLLRLLGGHPAVERVVAVSASKAGAGVREADPGMSEEAFDKMAHGGRFIAPEHAQRESPDLLVSALPHLASVEACRWFVDSSAGRGVLIDLSADLRLPDRALFRRAYGAPPPEVAGRAAYGLCELFREEIGAADLIANPGCYPTATLLALLPLVRRGLLTGAIDIFAISGVSGAGRAPKQDLLFCERSENVNAYAPGSSHRHWAEMRHYLDTTATGATLALRFIPHLAPIKQGIAMSAICGVRRGVGDDEIAACYREVYADAPFLRRSPRPIPETRDVRATNRCDYNWRLEGDTLYLFSVIDNLVKGAAGQAIQNMNIRFGLSETAGLGTPGAS